MAAKHAVGLDIGTSSLKVAHLRDSGKGAQLLTFDTLMLPHAALVLQFLGFELAYQTNTPWFFQHHTTQSPSL